MTTHHTYLTNVFDNDIFEGDFRSLEEVREVFTLVLRSDGTDHRNSLVEEVLDSVTTDQPDPETAGQNDLHSDETGCTGDEYF